MRPAENVHDLQLSHFAAEPVPLVHDVEQESDGDWLPKPNGLWVSVDGEYDWEWWCRAEDFRVEHLAHRHTVRLSPSANILHLNHYTAILGFGQRYADQREGALCRAYSIDWRRVADKYDGIIIAPYNWDLRLDDRVRWYYGWDCASGCIWKAGAIASITPIATKQAEAA